MFDPDEADLQILVEEFGLHPLAVEDAVHDHQRPKLDRYRSHMFANLYAVGVDLDAADDVLTTSEISAFITGRALITVRKSPFDVDTLIAHWDLANDAEAGDVSFLVYGLLDAIVDGHYAPVRELDEAVDGLEDQLFKARPGLDIRRRGFELRKGLAELRRVVAPMHELVGGLMRNDSHLVDERLAPYYRDRFKDAKLGAALRHLPFGHEAVNAVWMWAALLAVNLSVLLQALTSIDEHGRAHCPRLRRDLPAAA